MESFFKNLIRRLFLNTMACSKLFTVSPFILISTPTLSGAGRPFSFTLYHKRFPGTPESVRAHQTRPHCCLATETENGDKKGMGANGV